MGKAKKTLIVGATPNPSRYAFVAAGMFDDRDMEFIPIGIKKGELFGKEILDLRQKPALEDIDTITLYIGPDHQEEWIDYLLSLNPKRIIFNPGTENPEFFQAAKKQGVEVTPACTLVMLSTGQY
ncbi:MAG TPA: CoA-binding protein [Algoriphagus sp.]|jgi:predicted CoA-binding protein|uniref:CoA-binding protein n=1 Tax=Algoriphagus TaxID=246875 RepID=UPI000C5A7E1A|nr:MULTISPECIES: CoA-binding protein [Algoriphagus]MAL13489.1 CoA-binding protein [Algoriphagus sp.]MAN85896.1 CoA-binding protein [Algoriphagus sp.]HAD51813.1 CoA-binding protein [Algoriphagus sp.]HAH37363.1 CoA-binding protein [Algoriphagus sp.]HAS58906.1 CoA-binding protein [Algoriphagus sp.]|tara:strand:+ start:1412 stop:1786 length:375 start_codon:yes stop_codon:yes gene_type:complete